METVLTFRGRAVTAADVGVIRELIVAHPRESRRRLSQRLCEAWDWRQANGAPRDMVARGLMLALARAGHIELPAVKWRPPNPLAVRRRPGSIELECTPISGKLRELGALQFRQVRRTGEERCFNGLLEQHHYLGYSQPVGEQLKFMVYAGERPVALFSWSSAPRHLSPRDRYLGWSLAVRQRNLRFLAYNTRYLILPWVKVPHLASHLLSRMTRMLSGEWEKVYGHPVHFAETFVDSTRHRGTCYRAANWVMLGRTQGRGKDDLTHRPNRTIKDVLGLALVADFRERLCS
jgi:Druantia protein DruA